MKNTRYLALISFIAGIVVTIGGDGSTGTGWLITGVLWLILAELEQMNAKKP